MHKNINFTVTRVELVILPWSCDTFSLIPVPALFFQSSAAPLNDQYIGWFCHVGFTHFVFGIVLMLSLHGQIIATFTF